MRIKDWTRFQHFKDRRPPWIKLYRDLLDDPDWHSLDPLSAKILTMLWLVASEDPEQKGQLPSVRRLAFRLRIEEGQLKQSITKLNHWLIHDDISAISDRYQLVIPEGEGETEGETETEADGEISDAGASPRMRIPYQEIVDLYHELLPKNPRIHALTTKRKAQIRARWVDGSLPDLETWRQYFEFVGKSNFLTGMVMPRDGRKPFIANLEWLTNETNFTNVAEKKYHG